MLIKQNINDIAVYGYSCFQTAKTSLLNHKTRKMFISRITKNEKAQGILEYGLIIALVSLGVLVGVTKLKDTINAKLTSAGEEINRKGT